MPIGPSLRATDADRERVIGLLRTQLAAGALTPEEFSARAEAAAHARRRTDLDRLTRDLPAVTVPTTIRNPLRPLVIGALVAVAAFLLVFVAVVAVLGIGAMLGG
ncbi:Domain of uncharacterised function (DUF1707) [Nocardia otitidiscaviarum]|uniref:Domain of uncharacterized function (DUF1707) n=1 Tax=Nocardia otitidiscaviarum TaxID=1823 RepID=A0A379JIL2_9NOCA|nr:DUF1707 domain-containing protein [Nocardia otitidiscaviarum]MBF6239136.1 DUF1707 domain-containing protein [Nocardia otitidiscaviarum]SUD48407.1 Domain of uncharacterised function (DUF1707) [Nocardia otitidiscaviarum]